MSQKIEGCDHAQLLHRSEDSGDILLVIGKAGHMTDAGILQEPIRQPLPAPINRQRGIAACCQLLCANPVFLNILGAPGKKEDSAFGRVRCPEGDADAYAVLSVQPVGRATRGTGGNVFEYWRLLKRHCPTLIARGPYGAATWNWALPDRAGPERPRQVVIARLDPLVQA